MNEDKLDKVLEEIGRLSVSHARMEEKVDWLVKGQDNSARRNDALEKDMQIALLPIKAAKLLAAAATGVTAIMGVLKAAGKI